MRGNKGNLESTPKKELAEFRARVPEKVEAKLETIFERRHHTAATAAHLEEYIFKFVDEKMDKFIACSAILEQISATFDTQFTEIGKQTKQKYLTCAKRYIDTVEQARDQEEVLRENFNLNQYGSFTEFKNESEMIFYRLTGERPKGKIFFKRQGGYFLITFDEPEDYLKATNPENSKERGLPSGGQFGKAQLAGPLIKTKNEILLGWHMAKSIYLKDGGIIDNVILINSTQETNFDFDSILKHERQHYLNDRVFNYFTNLEPSTKDPKKARPIKDEALARIREGNDASTCTNFLSEGLYANLLRDTKFKKNEILELMGRIKKELQGTVDIFKSPHQRAILTNLLIDIPLEKWPTWLKEMSIFYKKCGYDKISKIKYICDAPQGKDEKGSDYYFLLNMRDFGPKLHSSFADEALKWSAEMDRISALAKKKFPNIETAEDLQIPLDNINETLQKYNEAKKNYQLNRGQFNQRYSVGIPQVEKYGVEGEQQTLNEQPSERLKKIGRIVSELILHVPEPEIVGIFKEFRTEGKAQEKTLALEKKINDAITANNTSECEVEIFRPQRWFGGIQCIIKFCLNEAPDQKLFFNYYIGAPDAIMRIEEDDPF